MKTKSTSGVTVLCIAMLAGTPALTAKGAGNSVLALGGRYHTDHSVFAELPFDKGDISYMLAYEFHEGDAYWHLGVGYCPDVTGSDTVDYVITPEVNLMLKDGIWRAGVGVLFSYIRDEIEGGDWTSLYWQLLVGIRVPVGSLHVGADVVYPFDKWGNIDEFSGNDLEYTGWIGYAF